MLKQVALSAEAEKVLEEKMQDNSRGDVIYFWGRLDMDGGVIGSNNALTFWSMCDILNGGNCRYIIWNITLYIQFDQCCLSAAYEFLSSHHLPRYVLY